MPLNALDSQADTAAGVSIVTLVSVGQHPSSGRARRADQDSKALELALTLADRCQSASLNVLHAGHVSDAQHQAVLREYIGMGVPSLSVLQQPSGADVVPAISARLRGLQADVVLTGSRAESGEGSGMMPYLIAQALGWPILPAAVDITALADGEFEVLQALPRGQRRLLKVRAPFVASVDVAATPARQTAWAAGQRGQLESVEMDTSALPDTVMADASIEPARKRPKRIAPAKKAKTAADRFKAATAKTASKGGAVMVNESASDKAAAIYDMLVSQGVVK
ncbi:electron transfer flavoprotein subunit beta [Bacterioplanoides sp.]|uniref:electron transfer flavoprotein subunit beta n=1 Tax=Bacterioplanoides sp. TaxID=2066072 RepID=UPI003B006454